MADLNALIAQGAQFHAPVDPFAQYAKMQQLEQSQRANQLAQMQMQKYQQDIERTNALRASPAPEGVSATHWAIDPKEALAIAKEQALTRKQLADTKESEEKVRASQMKALGLGLITALKDPSDAGLGAAFDTLDSQGIDTKPLRNRFSQIADPKQRLDLIQSYVTSHPEGVAAMKFVAPDPVEVKLTDGSIKFIDKNPNSPTFKQEVKEMGQAAGMTPFQQAEIKNQQGHLAVSQGQLKVSQDRLNAEMATGTLTPETKDFLAQTYIQTGTLPPMGMGKGAAKMRQDVLDRAAQLSMGGGTTAADAAGNVRANKAETAGMTAGQRTVGTQIANVQIAANEANKMIEVAKPYVTKVNPSDYPVLNAAGNFVAKNTGDPNIVGLATALNGLVNTYARAINPKGTATVSDKQHAREIINTAMSKGQINEAFAVMNQEMNAALASGPETRTGMRPGAAKPAATSTEGRPSLDSIFGTK